ncbi:tyrosine-type recombinase/integrase [Chloroflexota bacterium]
MLSRNRCFLLLSTLFYCFSRLSGVCGFSAGEAVTKKYFISPTRTYAFTRIARKAGLDGIRFHDLRHTFASLMLLRGAKPKMISEALGHSSVSFTMDVYNHIIEGMQEDAMALLDEVLPAGKNGTNNNINAKLTPTSVN